MKSDILSETQLNLLNEYAEDTLHPIMRTLWHLASASKLINELIKVLKILEDCCVQDRHTFIDNVCIEYDTRPITSERNDDKDVDAKLKVLSFLELFKFYKANKFSYEAITDKCEDKAVVLNFKIINALLSVNSLIQSQSHFFNKYVSDKRLNTKPKEIKQDVWHTVQHNEVKELMKAEILAWVSVKKMTLPPRNEPVDKSLQTPPLLP